MIESGVQGRIFTAMFLYQANSALTDFRRKLLGLIHGPILSKVGASTKPGAVHNTVYLPLEVKSTPRGAGNPRDARMILFCLGKSLCNF